MAQNWKALLMIGSTWALLPMRTRRLEQVHQVSHCVPVNSLLLLLTDGYQKPSSFYKPTITKPTFRLMKQRESISLMRSRPRTLLIILAFSLIPGSILAIAHSAKPSSTSLHTTARTLLSKLVSSSWITLRYLKASTRCI